MTIETTEELAAVAELAREIGTEILAPAARQAEADCAVPELAWKTLLETGLIVPLSEENGGGGIPDARTQVVALEHLAYGDAGITVAAFWSGAAALLLSRHGRNEQVQMAIALSNNPVARGAVALYEGYGRAPSEFTTSISTTAEGTLRVLGRKVGVAFGSIAEPLIVIGVAEDTHTLQAVLVPTDHPGVTVDHAATNLGLNASSTVTLNIDVTVPASNLVGTGENALSTRLETTVSRIRLALAAVQIGAAQRAIDYAANYAVDRVAFGRPIASFQGVSFPLAEAQMRIDQARLEIADVADALDSDETTNCENAIGWAVNHASEVAAEASRTGVQTLGGHGFITDHPSEMWYRVTAALSTLDFDPIKSTFQPAV